jgi:hypothetical protein
MALQLAGGGKMMFGDHSASLAVVISLLLSQRSVTGTLISYCLVEAGQLL